MGLFLTQSLPFPPVKAADARKEDLENQGEDSTALVKRLRVELEESRKVLSDLQARQPRIQIFLRCPRGAILVRHRLFCPRLASSLSTGVSRTI